MGFRPCIDIHQGRVKQIVGSSFSDTDAAAIRTNFETLRPAADFAAMYRRDNLPGGHVIMLGEGNAVAALSALAAWPGGMQVGGGIRPSNARQFLDAGASHVIVTSYVFNGGNIDWAHLEEISTTVGQPRLVLDVSCTRRDGRYLVVTDRWQNISDVELNGNLLGRLAETCSEFLVHAIDVEGKRSGVERDVVALLAAESPVPSTYAGGIASIEDLDVVEQVGEGRVDATVGSALDIFGGSLRYEDVVAWHRGSAGGNNPGGGT